MKRREFIAGLGSAAAWPMVAGAQTRHPTLGVLTVGNSSGFVAALEEGLADFGYAVGQNISLIRKDAAGNLDLNELAAELVSANVDVIFGGDRKRLMP
jgi:putative ABC transport system substrate-binding protein